MRLLTLTFALLAASVCAEEVLLLDDFEDGDLKSPRHGRWSVEYDPAPGGTSSGRVDAVTDGEGSVGRLTYSVSGGIGANIYMGLPVRMDVSAYQGVRFRFRTEHTSRVTFMLVTGTGAGRVCWWAHRGATSEWHETVVRWDELIESHNAQTSPALGSVAVLAVGSKTQPSAAEAQVLIDDLCLVRGEAAVATDDSERPSSRARAAGDEAAPTKPSLPTVEHAFEAVTFRCPEEDWLWDADTGTLDALTLATQVRFRSEPGQVAAREARTRFERKMNLVGMEHLLVGDLEDLEVGTVTGSVFTASGVPPAILTRKDPELTEGAHYDVLVLELGGHTYQVECRLPIARREELQPILRELMQSIRATE